MSEFFELSETIQTASAAAMENAAPQFAKIDALTEHNQQKVLSAFIQNRVDETDFNSTTGYGYNDKGREKLDRLTADIFGAEAAFIRAGALSCGTHTLSVCLYGVLRPGDVLLSVTGLPYDTIHSTIGIDNGKSAGKGRVVKPLDIVDKAGFFKLFVKHKSDRRRSGADVLEGGCRRHTERFFEFFYQLP